MTTLPSPCARPRRTLAPTAESLEMRRLLSGQTAFTTFNGLVRAGRETIFSLAVLNTSWLDHATDETIDWGDGSPVTSLAAGAGFFAKHDYANVGTYYAKVSATIQGAGHADYTASGVAKIDVVPRVFVASAHGPLYLKAGTSTLGASPVTIAMDDDAPVSATVDWGDGSGPAPATIAIDPNFPVATPFRPSEEQFYDGSKGLLVKSDHTFAAPGNYLAHVTVTGPDGSPQTIDVPVVVSGGSIVAHPSPDSFIAPGSTSPIAVTSQTIIYNPNPSKGPTIGLGRVEVFDSSFNMFAPVPFKGSVDWGDGTPVDDSVFFGINAGTYQPSGHLSVDVFGVHTFAAPGDYTATLTATASDGTVTTTQVHIHVHNYETQGGTLAGTAGQTASGTTLATINVPGQSANPGDYSATIDWGDGSGPSWATFGAAQAANDPSTGVPGAVNVVQVGGSHVYAAAGTYTYTITITGPGGEVRTVTGTATIGDPPFTAAGSPSSGHKGYTALVSRFGHPDAAKKQFVVAKAKAPHPGHRKLPHANPKGKGHH